MANPCAIFKELKCYVREDEVIRKRCDLSWLSAASIVVVSTALPLVLSNEWWIRWFDFPRLQIFILGSALGDLNDVAWSRTTSLFQKISGLLDPRIGRGMFNTFHADWFFIRFPLDHIFHSAHFKLIEMRRLVHIGSDHFPFYAALKFHPQRDGSQAPADPKPGEKEAAEDILEEAREEKSQR